MISFFDSIFKNNGFLSQQIQTDDELLEGGSKWTTLILSANTNTRRDDDRRYPLLSFPTTGSEPAMLPWGICY